MHFTAHRRRFDGQRMLDYYLEPTGLISCVVAADGGHVLGFQSLEWDRKDTDKTVGSIATFARLNTHRTGASRALFAETCARTRAAGVKKIDATIRADNVKGLGFYRSMGVSKTFLSIAMCRCLTVSRSTEFKPFMTLRVRDFIFAKILIQQLQIRKKVDHFWRLFRFINLDTAKDACLWNTPVNVSR